MSEHQSTAVYARVIHDDQLRERVASLLAKYADYIVAMGGDATEQQSAWAKYVLSDKGIPAQKAVSMMWRVCWNAAVRDAATETIDDNTLSAIIEPHAINY